MGSIPPPSKSQTETYVGTGFLTVIAPLVLVVGGCVVLGILLHTPQEFEVIEGKFDRVEYIPDGGLFGGPGKTVIYLMDGRTFVWGGHSNAPYKRNEKVKFRVPK